MVAVRRVYFYLVSGVSLGVLLVGLSSLGSVVLEMLLGAGAVDQRLAIASSAAEVLVAAPIWVLHWQWAQRAARRDPTEQGSALRRLYLYGAAAVLSLAAVAQLSPALAQLLGLLERSDAPFRFLEFARSLWQGALPAVFWTYHFRLGGHDRQSIGETGGSATLRRWYAYGIQVVALLNLLYWSQVLLSGAAAILSRPQSVIGGPIVATQVSDALVWLALWVFHFRWTNRESLEVDDRASTLRAVHGFGIVAWCTAVVLTEAARTLYYFLARGLGVPSPGGIPQLDAATLAQPLSAVLIYGVGWAFARYRLVSDAGPSEAPRQAGVRRLYSHLVALVSLTALAVGLGGLLDALFEQVVAPAAASSDSWRDQVSWSLTSIAVGLPVWVAHWRAAPDQVERLALSRRLYLFAALLVGVLSVLGSAGALVWTWLRALLAVGAAGLGVEGSRFLAALLVAGAVAGYHFRVLRQDAAQRAAAAPVEPEVVAAPSEGAFVVEVVGASQAELREALATLPAEARYSLRPAATPPPAKADHRRQP